MLREEETAEQHQLPSALLPEFWTNRQLHYDLKMARRER